MKKFHHYRAAGLLVGLTVFGCPNPATVNPPDPIKTGTQCEDAQRTLDTLDCSWKINAKKQTWASRCHALAETGYPRILVVGKCVEVSKTCEEAEACR